MDVVLLLQRTECRTHLPPFRYQPTDLLSLETKIRSPRPDHPGRAFAPAAPATQTHLVGGTGRTGAGSAQAVSALGQRQAGGAAAKITQAEWTCGAFSPHSQRRVLPGTCTIRSGARAQPSTASLGKNLQLRETSPVARLPHSIGIYHSMETQPQKGKVSLSYGTSTLSLIRS